MWSHMRMHRLIRIFLVLVKRSYCVEDHDENIACNGFLCALVRLFLIERIRRKNVLPVNFCKKVHSYFAININDKWLNSFICW